MVSGYAVFDILALDGQVVIVAGDVLPFIVGILKIVGCDEISVRQTSVVVCRHRGDWT